MFGTVVMPIVLLNCCTLMIDRWPMYCDDMGKNARIDLYGQVVDAQGKPVQGAVVRGVVGAYNPLYIVGASRDWERQIAAVTDAQGCFSFEAYWGDGLGIQTISKPDYEWLYGRLSHSDDNVSYEYAPHGGSYLPDRDKRAIFPLVRHGEKAMVLPSRGGADRRADGSVVPNKPVAPNPASIPWALPERGKL
jgi:hypothetical protein